MRKFSIASCLLLIFLFVFSQQKKDNTDPHFAVEFLEADKVFNEAERLADRSEINEIFVPAAENKFRNAMSLYLKFINVAETQGNDSLSFLTFYRTAFIAHYLDSLSFAKQCYLKALEHKERNSFSDSLFFKPALYVSTIYYSENKFDSTILWLNYAGAINDRFGGRLDESERFFNISGTLNYQSGNYIQAKNYFEKALSLFLNTKSNEKSLGTNYKINIGASLIKLEYYDAAKKIFDNLLKEKVFNNEIYQHIGFIELQQNNYEKSLQYFKEIDFKNDKKITDVYLNMAMAFSGLGKKDSSELYLLKAKEENLKWYGQQKNISKGLIFKFQADDLAKKNEYKTAISFYQQAIIQFCPEFNDPGTENNPQTFSSTFSYINLFNTLAAKGYALQQLYNEHKELTLLENSFVAFKSAFNLADFVEKTYSSDEARLFLGKIKYSAHSKPIDVCLLLFDLTQNKKYLEEAFHFDQQNKASVLALNVQENELRGSNTVDKILFEQVASLRSAITRTSLKMAQTTDSIQLDTLHSSILDNEIQLDKLLEKINNDPAYRNRYFTSKIPDIHELQKKLDNTTAILSWHLSEKRIVVFLITGNQFLYNSSAITDDFYKNIDSFKLFLQNTISEKKYNGSSISKSLYKFLIAPLEAKLSNIDRLIIIPDDELNYLPFEALMDEKGRYMVEKFSIQYLYSTALLEKDDNSKKAKGILAFAPFASKEYNDSAGNHFFVLPASKEETSNLQGKIFTDSSAIKNNFLTNANHYGIIHLATHASVNNEMPLRSFIAFYPGTIKDSEDYKLYAREIYDLNLDSTQLVILSACETGAGKLVRGEGLMSLSRAFAYAGCPNIITSLWKAEDKTTAFITKKIHYYIDKGFTKDKALQQAKLDLLKSDETDPRFKTPNYWAHLIFIGNYEPDQHALNWWWIAIAIIISAIIYIFIKQKA